MGATGDRATDVICVTGLDLGLASTGIVTLDSEGGCHVERIRTKTTERNIDRRRHIVEAIIDHLAGTAWITHVVMEASVLTRFASSLDVVMLHGQTLDALDRFEMPTWTIPAASIKKHATGNGLAKKPQMIEAAQRAGYPGKQEDESDAWLCAAIGLHLAGVGEPTAHQASCLQAAQLVIGRALRLTVEETE